MFDAIFGNTVVIAVVAIVLALALALWAVSSRYRIAKADEAIVVTGRKGGQRIVIAGGVFVLPFVERADVLGLHSRSLSLRITEAVSSNNIPLDLGAVATVKIGGTDSMVQAAAQRFLTQQEEIERFITDTMTGSLRAIVGGMTVEEVIRDRAGLAQKVRDEAEMTLTNQGLMVDNLTIQSVTDAGGYIANLARPEAARARRDAEVAEAEALQVAAEKRAAAEQKIAEANKELALTQATIQAETDQANAVAQASGPLAKAARDEEILAAEELVAQKQIALTAAELESTVNRQADAELYRRTQEAEAARVERVAQARADAEAVQLAAAATLDQRTKEAEAVRIAGEAEASAIQAKGQAEAAAIDAKAEAMKKYGDAAMAQMLVDVLPKVAAEIATPLASVEGMTIVSTDGASSLTRSVAEILSQTLTVAKDLTGVDFAQLGAGRTEAPAAGTVTAPPASPAGPAV